MEQWNKGVMAFIGPEDSCETEAMIAAAQNLPMISFKCFDHSVSDKSRYSTFARTVPAESQVSKAAIALLKHYNWRKFSIVYGMNTVNTHLLKAIEDLSDMEDLKIQNVSGFMEPYVSLNTEERKRIRAIIAETLYVFFGSVSALQDVLYTMDDLELMKEGEYVVIYLEPSYTYLNADDAMMNYFYRSTLYTVEEFHNFPFVNRIVDLSRSLLAIIPSPVSFTNPEWRHFWRMVTEYNAQPPFNFFNPASTTRLLKYGVANRYASYLYDAVMLYATALHEVIQENGSIQGFEMQIDEKGDAEGNFTLLTRQHLPESKFNLTYGLVPSGYFIEKNDTLPGLMFKSNLIVDWPGGKPPEDEPECGFNGEYCIEQPSYGVEIVCGAVGVVLMILSVVSFIYYRNRKYEQELAGLIWKINPKEIQFHPCTGYDMLSNSKTTLCSQDSTEFAAWPVDPHGLGVYRGSLVAIKEIRYAKRTREISRATKIEMKKMRGLHHDNVNRFLGIIIQSNFVCVVREYCAKGSLFDVLLNENVRLDSLFIASFIDDLLKVSDFGLSELREGQVFGGSNEGKYFGMLWTAPEHLLENPEQPVRGSQKGDVYSFAIILHEIFSRNGPFGIYYDDSSDPEGTSINTVVSFDLSTPCLEIVNSVMNSNGYCRPSLHNVVADKYILDCMVSCWDERPETRPDFHQIRTRLKPLFKGILKRNIMDHMMAMMEKYQTHLEELVEERTEELKEEKKRTEILLHRMLPKVVAAQLMSGKDVIPETFDSVTIYFSDIVGFTALSAESTPVQVIPSISLAVSKAFFQVVAFLNALYTLFDRIIRQYDVYKVETIGDAYMVVSGLPVRNGDQHAGEIATMALRLLEGVKSFKIPHKPDKPCLLRIGVHTGPCAAGVVGKTMPRYCLFGDTVNTASRMESNGMRKFVAMNCNELNRHFIYCKFLINSIHE
ncbi:unnamed protein product [Soboliphyme baturini]|uniref:Guanylate cyclase n=1 Tax=Soboliphyme baturini TaxID=241478 RepID=A0A183IDD1_9BILA|nr:unnamed protein product [Soboliphyme baturini]